MIWSIGKNIDLNKINIDEKSYKNISVGETGYVTVTYFSYAKIGSINSLCIITNKINGYIEESNGKEYLTLVPTEENKNKLKTYEEQWKNSDNLLDQKLKT